MDEFNRREDLENLRQIPVINKTLEYISADMKIIKEKFDVISEVKSDVGWLTTATKWLYGIVAGIAISIVTIIFKK